MLVVNGANTGASCKRRFEIPTIRGPGFIRTSKLSICLDVTFICECLGAVLNPIERVVVLGFSKGKSSNGVYVIKVCAR